MPSPELRAPLAVVCHDAGACNVILPWLAQAEIPLRPVMQGPAAALYAERARRVPHLGRTLPLDMPLEVTLDVTLERALDGAAMLLSGTGWASDLEHRARRLARERGLFSAAVIDHWINYEARFERAGEVVWPDEFWVSDLEALALARRHFPVQRVRRFENLYLRETVDAIPPTPRRSARLPNVLLVMEPQRSGWGRSEPGEFQALDHFMRERVAAGIPAGAPVRVRPHPSDPPGKYDGWIAAQRAAAPAAGATIDMAPDPHASLAQAIGASAWVAGCESFALVVALAAGRRVYSMLPPWAPPCRLPHQGIVRLGRSVAGARVDPAG